MKKSMTLLVLLLTLIAIPGWSQFDSEGQFLYILNEEIVAEESFTFSTNEDGNTLLESVFILLSEEFLLEFETDRLFDQTVIVTPDLALVTYILASDTAQGNFNIEVQVEDNIASMTFSTTDNETEETRGGEQDVILEDNAIASGVSGSGSQMTLLQEIIFAREINEPTTLLGFNPTDLFNPLVEVEISPLDDIAVTGNGGSFQAQRFLVSQLLTGEGGDAFNVELLSQNGKLIGYQAFSQTSTLLVYRADLFPNGLVIGE